MTGQQFSGTTFLPAGVQGAAGLDVQTVMAVLGDLWEHKDDILRVTKAIPDLLGDAGEFMHLAGQGAQRASGFLTGEIREIAATAADVLGTSTAQLKNVLTVLDNIGTALSQVPFLDDLGAMITKGLDAIMGVADNVDAVGGRVRALGEKLGDVGSDIDRMGKSLVSGGQRLADFGGKPVQKLAPFAGLPPVKPQPVKVKPVKVVVSRQAAARRAALATPAPVSTPAKPAKK